MTPPAPLDPFEQRLAAIPPRELPPELRTRILANARAAKREPWTRRLAALLWPHPLAWGALAAGWLAIAALNVSGPCGPELYAVTPSEYRDRLPAPEASLLRYAENERRITSLVHETDALQRRPILNPQDL